MSQFSETWTNQKLLNKLEETVDLVSDLVEIVKEQGQMISELQSQFTINEEYALMSLEEDSLIQEETDDIAHLSKKMSEFSLWENE